MEVCPNQNSSHTSVNTVTNQPLYSALFFVTGSFLVLLFSLSPMTSNIIYSLASLARVVTFIIPMALRVVAGRRWIPGKFTLGRYSELVHGYSVLFQLYIFGFFSLPVAKSGLTADTLNWNVCMVDLFQLSFFALRIFSRTLIFVWGYQFVFYTSLVILEISMLKNANS
jgi:hypothetical protein